jgi:hypothetical protein
MSRHAPLLPVLLTAATLGSASIAEQPSRQLPASTVTIQFPADLGDMQRPAVEFDHKAHTDALETEGCETCHRIDDKGVLIPRLAAVLEVEDRDDLIDAYHDSCVGCHRERADEELKAGPVTCGECHVKQNPARSMRAEMAFDYSLHGRHSQAFKDKCENCHHVYDEVAEELKYEKGKEEGCRSCHGEVDDGRNYSLANASHRTCVSCHLKRAEAELETGPTLCVGCHDPEVRDAIKKLDEVPRLMRGQPDTAWIHSVDAKSATVPFDHIDHEPVTSTCSTCHHQTLKPCDECHSLEGLPEGSGVTMSQAYHRSESEHSCVGCHARHTAERGCAGCHQSMSQLPGENTCVVCHNGPPAGSPELEMAPMLTEAPLDVLPVTSDEFPEEIVIESLTDDYQASKLPHLKIVTKLDGLVRESKLAVRFHGDTETLCAGCHHHSPVGTRPPPCRACHAAAADPIRDRPGLKVAYHRQCMGCHIKMDLKQQGCTDCHAERSEEVES